jgi:hypothetical protein
VAEPARIHKLDADSLNGGRILLVLGIVVGPFGTIVGGQALLGGDGGAVVGLMLLLVPGIIGLACIPIGLRALAIPTAGGSVRVGPESLDFTLRRGRTFSIPWAEVSHWGVVPRPLLSSSSLIVWPGKNVTSLTKGSGDHVWSKRHQGWVVEAIDPGPELIADLEAVSPRPRQDVKS